MPDLAKTDLPLEHRYIHYIDQYASANQVLTSAEVLGKYTKAHGDADDIYQIMKHNFIMNLQNTFDCFNQGRLNPNERPPTNPLRTTTPHGHSKQAAKQAAKQGAKQQKIVQRRPDSQDN
jgi:hypothetical protein